ncbi:ATP-binding cassette transporter [Selaginella moellendorffii]|uniref:ATP-binding cassette transporter n=1 Tax=Selaginella moellendorffii TaxID=88036 RepID=D8R3R8_SELML|nr:ATP-binding cassette transporter [Selaginella moellendorffii]
MIRDGDCKQDVDDEPVKEQPHATVSYLQLFSFADYLDYVLIFLGTVGASVHGAAIPGFFVFFGKMIDEFGKDYNNPHKMGHEVSKYSLYFVYLGLVILVAAWLEVSCWTYTGERQSSRMRTHYLKAMLSQDVGFFDTDATTGEIVIGISSDTALVQEAIGPKAGNYVHYMARFFAGFAVGFTSVWQLTLLTLAVVPAIAVAGGAYAYTMVGLTTKNQKAYARAGEIAEETISQVRTVYSFVGEEKAQELYSRALETTLKLGKSGGLAKGLGLGATYGLTFGSWALLLWYAGVLVRHGTTNGGEAFTTILNVVISSLSLGNAAPNLGAFAKGKAAGYNILEMIKRKPAINPNTSDGKTISNVQGNIEFVDIHFSYPSRPDVTIFQKLCLKIPQGKTVAIVGGSGSGKSTVIALIERFYDPMHNLVRFSRHQDVAAQMATESNWSCESRAGIICTTIRENILLGKPDASDDEIFEAATVAGAHAFIQQLPDGYETQVGEKGVQLSGGQKQRVAITRAMVKNPSILLLDEATSALDAASEQSVQEALDTLMIGRTTVVVAHRLSTVQNADIIAVVQGGKIVETGTHSALMAKGESGAYCELVRLQEAGKAKTLDGPPSKHSRYELYFLFIWFPTSLFFRLQSDAESQSIIGMEEDQRLSLPKPSFRRLLKLNAREWPQGVLGAFGAILAGVEMPFFAFGLTQVLVTYYNPDKHYVKKEVEKYVFFFTGLTILAVLANTLEHYFFGYMGECLTMRVRNMMFSAILKNELGWFEKADNYSSLVSSQLASDATLVRAAVGDRLSILLQNSALILGGFIIAFVLQWKLTLIVLALFPLLISAHVGEHLFMKGFGVNLSKVYARASVVAGEAVSNIRTVAAFCGESKVLELFNRQLEGIKKNSFARGQVAGLGYGLAQCCLYSSYGLALWYAAKLIKDGDSSFGPVIKCFILLIFTAFGVAETLALAPDLMRSSRAVGSVFAILDRKTEIDPDEPDSEVITHIRGDIEFKRVNFSYPSRPDVAIFYDLNLKVRAGSSLALVGASGSGKSSVVALIQRFYDPSAGKVLIDGMDIRRINLKSLRLHIGLVQQEPALFATSIYENVAYGRDGATESEVVEAAKAGNAHSFISSLPDGYQTQVGERGTQLSGGQKQRVAIARAVLKNPAILLLDEATSALDAQSEKVVQEALDRLMRGRTTVLVAHRLSTIQNAGVIAVVEGGRIVEQGSHRELMAKGDGAYARLVRLQQMKETR